ncbi:hypothetical protein C0991_007058 [Blastosporella zonata]|nr:hypothetical protein C0991_007058 [Blastosporella zonata]
MDDKENCALCPDGTLKDASKITWLNSPSDKWANPFDKQESLSPSGTAAASREASPALVGLSNKMPATLIAGKYRITANSRFINGLREPSFFKSIRDAAIERAKWSQAQKKVPLCSQRQAIKAPKRKEPTAPNTAPAPKKHKSSTKEVQQTLASHETSSETDSNFPASVSKGWKASTTTNNNHGEEGREDEPDGEKGSEDEGKDEDDGDKDKNRGGNVKLLTRKFEVKKVNLRILYSSKIC